MPIRNAGDYEVDIEYGHCAGHHFCRVKIDIGKWHVTEDVTEFISEVVIGEGVAKRTRKDRNDDYVGENLALGRALENLSKKVLRRAKGKVKHNDDMKLSRAVKKDQRRLGYAESCKHTCIYEIKNARIVGAAFQSMFGDTHFEDTVDELNDESERLIDEC